MNEYPVSKKVRKLFRRSICAKELSVESLKLLSGFDRALEYMELSHKVSIKAWVLFFEAHPELDRNIAWSYNNAKMVVFIQSDDLKPPDDREEK